MQMDGNKFNIDMSSDKQKTGNVSYAVSHMFPWIHGLDFYCFKMAAVFLSQSVRHHIRSCIYISMRTNNPNQHSSQIPQPIYVDVVCPNGDYYLRGFNSSEWW